MGEVMLKTIVDEYKLKLLVEDIDIEDVKIVVVEINRPALQLTGFYDYFQSDRLQIIGEVEYAYLSQLTKEERTNTLKKLFSYKIPCLILCRGIQPFDEMVEIAKEKKIPVLGFNGITSEFVSEVIRFLTIKLAPEITMHGVLVDVYGEGVLIIGESGVGKSETAIELIKRGHRLVADDAVEITKVSNETLVGKSPQIIRYFIELRGIGIIDVKQMFGVHSIKETHSVDLILNLEFWDEKKEYDRLGINDEYKNILGNDIICLNIPVRPGRNLAVICECAAINHRQKKMGYNSAKTLNQNIIDNLNK